jgi:hypothetical protein
LDADDPDPLSGSGAGGYNGDYDNDGWQNWEEIEKGTDPADPNSAPQVKPPRVKKVYKKKQVIPSQKAGPVSNDSCFAVLLESEAGIDMTDDSAVKLTINDGVSVYERHLNAKNANNLSVVEPLALKESGGQAKEFWVVYYKVRESVGETWPFSAVVEVQLMARDCHGNSMSKAEVFYFTVESEETHNQRDYAKPHSEVYIDPSGVTTITNTDTGASVVYEDAVPVQPYFDEQVPFHYLDAQAVSEPAHLGPHVFFPNGVTVFIPFDGNEAQSDKGFMIYGFDGEDWVPIIDSNGNDLTEGSWVVQGWNNGLSWKVDLDGISIRVLHFSGFTAAQPGSSSQTTEFDSETGGCFISSLTQ